MWCELNEEFKCTVNAAKSVTAVCMMFLAKIENIKKLLINVCRIVSKTHATHPIDVLTEWNNPYTVDFF